MTGSLRQHTWCRCPNSLLQPRQETCSSTTCSSFTASRGTLAVLLCNGESLLWVSPTVKWPDGMHEPVGGERTQGWNSSTPRPGAPGYRGWSTRTTPRCQRRPGCHHSRNHWATNLRSLTTRRRRLLFHSCGPVCAPVDAYGGRCLWLPHAPLCRPRGRRTATGHPHQFIDRDSESGCPPGTSPSRQIPKSWHRSTWGHSRWSELSESSVHAAAVGLRLLASLRIHPMFHLAMVKPVSESKQTQGVCFSPNLISPSPH